MEGPFHPQNFLDIIRGWDEGNEVKKGNGVQ